MITVSDIEEILQRDEYRGYRKPLGEISRDDSGHNKTCLGNFNTGFLKYDDIVSKYLYKKNPHKAPDMVFFYKQGIYFVEFKTGRIERIRKKCKKYKKDENSHICENTDNCKNIATCPRDKCKSRKDEDECTHVKMDIKLKGIEGAFIALRDLILKYRENVNFSNIMELEKFYILVYNPKRNPKSPGMETVRINSRDRIHNGVSAGSIKFGLHIYRKTFFRDVGTHTPNFFLKWLIKRNLLDESDIKRVVECEGKKNDGN